MCSGNDIPNMDLMNLCIITNYCSYFFEVAHILLAYNIIGKTVLLKRLAGWVLYKLVALMVDYIILLSGWSGCEFFS